MAVLHRSSSSDAAYPTYTPGTTALPAAAPALAVGTEYWFAGGLPLSLPGSDVPSECATSLWMSSLLLCMYLLRVSQLHYRVQRLTLCILCHLTPKGRRLLWLLSAVPGNLYGYRSSALSLVGLALGIFCLYGIAGSIDPSSYGRQSPRSILGVA